MTDQTTVLLDIVNRLGVVEGQNQLILEEQGRAAEGRKQMYRLHEENLRRFDKMSHHIEEVVDDIKVMKPEVDDMKAFKVKLAVASVFVTAILTGAINLIVIGLSNMGQIKTVLRDFLK